MYCNITFLFFYGETFPCIAYTFKKISLQQLMDGICLRYSWIEVECGYILLLDEKD